MLRERWWHRPLPLGHPHDLGGSTPTLSECSPTISQTARQPSTHQPSWRPISRSRRRFSLNEASSRIRANRREGTLEVTVAPPERDPDPERSPWEGMSGAAVWSAGRIIGLVAEHHRADGLGRLAATRVDHWYEQLAPDRLDQLRTLLPVLPIGA